MAIYGVIVDTMSKDYYKTLGIERDADDAAIKTAYRSLAKKYHPDTNPDNEKAEAMFKEVGEAYDVLKNPAKRSNYDQFGDADGPTAPPHGFRSANGGDINDIINDFIRNGGMGGNSFHFRHQMRNADISASIAITLEDAYSGVSVPVELSTPPGDSSIINVTVPPGAKDGMVLRVKGKGLQQNTDLPPGDLHLSVRIAPHHQFKVLGMDLYAAHDISMIDAALGCEITVPMIDGPDVSVTVPEGTQPNQKIRLKGKGMAGFNNSNVHGDLYINMNITIPANLTEKQKEILENFRVS